MTEEFYFSVSPGTRADTGHRVRGAKFGDGYAQFAKDGINARASRWTVEMANLTEDKYYEVTAFLDRNAGRSFYWTPPTNRRGRYMCKGYSEEPALGDLCSLSATFEETFAP
ncbi:MAG TPA: phage tail protein [Rhodanobacteraceae bacterium]|nr:phage tail protein [Rhodanobacteraceae bacterium]